MTNPNPDPTALIRDTHPAPGVPNTLPMSRVLDELLDAGLDNDRAIMVASKVRSIAVEHAFWLAASLIRHCLRRLGKTAASEALQRVLLGSGDESLREAAARAGCSHVNILKLETDIRERLGLPPTGNR